MVDDRDVAAAHVAALGLPAGKPRRYAVSAQKKSPTHVEIAELMAETLPDRKLPAKVSALSPSAQKLLIFRGPKPSTVQGSKTLALLFDARRYLGKYPEAHSSQHLAPTDWNHWNGFAGGM